VPDDIRLSPECRETLTAWVRAHWPGWRGENEFLAGLFFVVDEEVGKAVGQEWERLVRGLSQVVPRN
jgi:hypothetical protein